MRGVLWTLVGLVLLVGPATAAPVPKALKKAKPLRARIEPLPGEKLHTVNWDDVPFAVVAEELEKQTGLMFLSKDAPTMNITLRAEDVCVWELFAQLDDLLYPEGWILIRKTQSFCTMPSDARIPRMGGNMGIVSLKDLRRRSQYEVLSLTVEVDEKGSEAGVELGKSMKDTSLEVMTFGSDKLLVRGRGKELRAFVAEMGDHIRK